MYSDTTDGGYQVSPNSDGATAFPEYTRPPQSELVIIANESDCSPVSA